MLRGQKETPQTIFFNIFPTSRLWASVWLLGGRSHGQNREIVKAAGVKCVHTCTCVYVCARAGRYALVPRQGARGG